MVVSTDVPSAEELEWVALLVCFDSVAEALKARAHFSGGDLAARLVYDGLREAFAALAGYASVGGLRAPDPNGFCCCKEPEAQGAICIIHAALAIRSMDGG